MPRIPDITQQDGIIHQGATFYWEVTLYDDSAHTELTQLDMLTPRATLMTPKGVHVADCSCAYLEATATKPKRIALSVPKTVTKDFPHGSRYLYNLDLEDSNGNAYRKLYGELTVERGQPPV